MYDCFEIWQDYAMIETWRIVSTAYDWQQYCNDEAIQEATKILLHNDDFTCAKIKQHFDEKYWLIVTQTLKQRFLASIIAMMLVKTIFNRERKSFTSFKHIREFFNVLSASLIAFVSTIIVHFIREWQTKNSFLQNSKV